MTTKTLKEPAAQLIAQEIKRHGPMSFAQFMNLALYHPTYGYYCRTASPRGRGGDYFTSMQVGGLFPKIMADAVIEMKRALGTEQFHLFELGSGSGEFLEGVLTTLEEKNENKGIHVWAIETSPKARDLLWRRLSRFPKTHVIGHVDDVDVFGGVEGCLFSNEFFDAVPFHRLRFVEGKWREIFVDVGEDGFFEKSEKRGQVLTCDKMTVTCQDLTPFETPFEGQEIEVRSGMDLFWGPWASLLMRGYVVTFDYGYPRADLYHPHRMKGTWRCFSAHGLNEKPYERIGRQDITAHIDFTQLAETGKAHGFEPSLFCSQSIFLSHVGEKTIQALLQQGKGKGAVRQLLHPDAMGEAFWMLAQSKKCSLPASFARIPNRARRLN